MKAIGLDIGTTTICGVVIDVEEGDLVDVHTVPNDSAIESVCRLEKIQDTERILEICQELLMGYLEKYKDILCIGITGQMHGIVYIDDNGKAVSPLYTWQNQSEECLVEELSNVTGYHMAEGFGLTTYYNHMKAEKVPKTAVSFCAIPDYVVMALTGRKQVLMHQSMAASLGIYNPRLGGFDKKVIEKAGMDSDMLPEITEKEIICGEMGGNIPVAVAFGDNQASFLGAIDSGSEILLNIGTGSQISAYSDEIVEGENIECRPYLGHSFLLVGSALSGGYAYSLVKRFFDELLSMLDIKCGESLYDIMNCMAEKAYREETQLIVDTRFNGTRKNRRVSGSITGITSETFHPGNLVAGVLQGICEELYGYYKEFPDKVKKNRTFVGSGNGLRKNHLLCKICCERFGMDMKIPKHSEEAAYGAALFSLLSCGKYKKLEEIQRLIKTQFESKRK